MLALPLIVFDVNAGRGTRLEDIETDYRYVRGFPSERAQRKATGEASWKLALA